MQRKPSIDHKNNRYPSLSKMYSAYCIPPSTYITRRKRGLPVEDSLTLPSGTRIENKVKDHLGNIYPTRIKMAESYGMNYYTFIRRIERGWSLEKALTTPIKKRKSK